MNVIIVIDWSLETIRVIPHMIFEYALLHNGEEQFPTALLDALIDTAFADNAFFLLKEYSGLDWNDPEYISTPIDLLIGNGLPSLEYGVLKEFLNDAIRWGWNIVEEIKQESLDSLIKK